MENTSFTILLRYQLNYNSEYQTRQGLTCKESQLKHLKGQNEELLALKAAL